MGAYKDASTYTWVIYISYFYNLPCIISYHTAKPILISLLMAAFDSLMHIMDLLDRAESRGYGSYLKCQFRNVECQMQCVVSFFFVCHFLYVFL